MRLRQHKKNKIYIFDLIKLIRELKYDNGNHPSEIFEKDDSSVPIPFAWRQHEYQNQIYLHEWMDFINTFFWQSLTGGHEELRNAFPKIDAILTKGTIAINGITITAILGRGHDGVVFETASGNALKVVSINFSEKLQHEYDILRRIDSQYVIKAFDFFSLSHCSCMSLELLSPSLGCLGEYKAGLSAIFNSGCVHGDIRYANLGTDCLGRGKIFDLGNASSFSLAESRAELHKLETAFKTMHDTLTDGQLYITKQKLKRKQSTHVDKVSWI